MASSSPPLRTACTRVSSTPSSRAPSHSWMSSLASRLGMDALQMARASEITPFSFKAFTVHMVDTLRTVYWLTSRLTMMVPRLYSVLGNLATSRLLFSTCTKDLLKDCSRIFKNFKVDSAESAVT